MKRNIFAYFILLLVLFGKFADAKRFLRCELAKLLVKRYRFDRSLVSNWICMIEHESGRDTSKVTRNPNGNNRYGLFQISSKNWCKEGRKGGACNARCEDFLNDNLDDDVQCAKKVWNADGFKHWAGWNRWCRDQKNVPNLIVLCRLNEIRKRKPSKGGKKNAEKTEKTRRL